jgi:hypothetical protein
MPNLEFHDTEIVNNLKDRIVSITMEGNDGNPSETILKGEPRKISKISSEADLLGGTYPLGPYRPEKHELFLGGKGTFEGTSDAESLTLIGSNPRIGSIVGPEPEGTGYVITFSWREKPSTELFTAKLYF